MLEEPEDPNSIKLGQSLNPSEIAAVEAMADIEDGELTQWQRIMRVNKQMMEVGIQKLIKQQLEPVYEH
jgi:hypothetical protein